MRMLRLDVLVLVLASMLLLPEPSRAGPTAQEVGVVVMHGKGGRPESLVDVLAKALEQEGFLVASIEMPWSGARNYDVDLNAGVGEVTRALDGLRQRGARQVFVAGHSQGGIFALLYGGLHRVDGIAAIAPGGQVDVPVYLKTLGRHVAEARRMVADGQGRVVADFADYEGSRGTSGVRTSAAIYLSWFDPDGVLTSRVFGRVLAGVPVLYVSPTRDYPGLVKMRQPNFGALPPNPLTRLHEPDSDHRNAPGAAAPGVIKWIREVAGF